MPRSLLSLMLMAIVVGSGCLAQAADEPKFEVREWSVWVTAPNQENFNDAEQSPSALPSFVESARSGTRKADDVSPVSVLSFRGDPPGDLDLSVRLSAGRFAAHWPKSTQTEKRVRWQGLKLSREPGDQQASFVGEHWFTRARELDRLYVHVGTRTERFVAYDAIPRAPVPLELEGGPDKYTAKNLGKFPVRDVLVLQPTPAGRRIGWADALNPPEAKPAAAEPISVVELEPKHTLRGHKGAVLCAAIAPNGARIATGGEDGTIRLWDAKTGELQMTLEGHSGAVHKVKFVADARLVSAGHDKTVRVWDATTGKQERLFDKHKAPVTTLLMSATTPMGQSADEQGQAHRWNSTTVDAIGKPIKVHSRAVLAAAESPNGRYIVTASADKTAKIWIPRNTPTEIGGTLKGHHGPVTSVSCGRDNQSAVTGSEDGELRQWNLANRQETARIAVGGKITDVAYLPGTDRLAVANAQADKCGIWDVPAKQLAAKLKGHTDGVTAVAPSSDGNLLATASRDGTAIIYDLSSLGGVKTVAGPPVEIAMSAPLAADAAEFKTQGIDEWKKRLAATGLETDEIELIATAYEKPIFDAKELVVVCRLADDAINELQSLDVFPEPTKTTRVAIVVIRKIDPGAKAEIEQLVKQLGDDKYDAREAAEKRLGDLGSAALPALREALKNTDLEVVFRAERLLAAKDQK